MGKKNLTQRGKYVLLAGVLGMSPMYLLFLRIWLMLRCHWSVSRRQN